MARNIKFAPNGPKCTKSHENLFSFSVQCSPMLAIQRRAIVMFHCGMRRSFYLTTLNYLLFHLRKSVPNDKNRDSFTMVIVRGNQHFEKYSEI